MFEGECSPCRDSSNLKGNGQCYQGHPLVRLLLVHNFEKLMVCSIHDLKMESGYKESECAQSCTHEQGKGQTQSCQRWVTA